MTGVHWGIASNLTGALILVLVFSVLYRSTRERHLGCFALSWAFYFARFGLLLAQGPSAAIAGLALVENFCSLLSTYFLLRGTYGLRRKPFHPAWNWVALAVALWVAACVFLGLPFLAVTIPVYLLLGLAQCWNGAVILSIKDVALGPRLMTGLSLVIWGVHKFNYPFLYPLDGFRPFGLMLGGALALLTAVGMLLIYHEMNTRALRRSEARYRGLFAAAGDAIYLTDASGRLLDVNDQACSQTGYSREELLAMSVWDVDGQESSAQFFSLVPEILARGLLTFETSHRRKDGSQFPVELRVAALDIAGGPMVMGLARDISERKAMEEALRAGEARLSLALQATNDGLWDWNVASGDVHLSSGYGAMLGYDAEALPGRFEAWADLIHPGDRPEALAGIRRAHDSGEGYRAEFRLRHRDGTWRWILARGRVVERMEDGRPRRMAGTHTDITARRLAEEALRQSEARYRNLFERSIDGIALFQGLPPRIAHANQAFADLSGYTAAELLAMEPGEIWNLVHPDDRDKVRASLRSRMEGDVESVRYSFRLLRKDGSVRWVEVTGARMDMQGEPGNQSIYRDVTDIRRMMDDLVQALARAGEAARAKSLFLATMSHELRTPLSGVMAMLQLTLQTPLSREQGEYLETALRSSRHLLDLLGDILDFSRIDAGSMELHSEVFSLETLLRPIAATFEDEARRRRLDFSVEVEPGTAQWFEGDSRRVRQVLFNLAANAVKYTEKGRVRLDVYSRPHAGASGKVWLHAEVADTGIGIPDEKLNEIFEVFTQVTADYTRKHGGTGLGLSIVKRLVTVLGGSLAVESEEGRGTVVHVALPLAGARDPSARGEAGPEPPAVSLRVLVAEDERVNLMAALTFLKKMGHRARGVGNGRQALEALEQEPFDVVLMDVQMPEMDGIEATRRIRKDTSGRFDPRIPVVALTAHAMSGDREQLLAQGMTAYLSKPYDAEDLKRIIASAVSGAAHPSGPKVL